MDIPSALTPIIFVIFIQTEVLSGTTCSFGKDRSVSWLKT